MECRKNVSDLSPTEKATFVNAVLGLKTAPSLISNAQTAVTNGGGTPNRYDDYVWIHSVVGAGAHRGPAFGPWHREFLRQFERDLRQVSGNPNITVPYWDWTTARTAADAGWPFTSDFLGDIGDPITGQISTSPFADPTQWRINIRNAGDTTLVLKRGRGVWGQVEAPTGTFTFDPPTRGNVLPALGVGSFDVAPFHSNPGALTPTQRAAQMNVAFRKFLEWALHDSLHVWVGGLWNFDAAGNPQDGGHISFPPVAVNDPAFWLHHCNVDRLWTIWQQRNLLLPYQPAAGANVGHNLNDTMQRFSIATHFNFPIEGRPVDVVDWHGDQVWYSSDLPVVSLVSGSVSFGNVPEGLTTHRPVQFNVRTCQPVRFRVTAVGGANYSDPLPPGGVTLVNHDPLLDPVTGNVYLQFRALGPAGAAQPGSATIEAYIEDHDGYFAPTVGGQYVVGTFNVTMTATPVARPRTAIALVLDRSGSMSDSAGVLGTKYQLLQSSLQVVSDIMRDTDAVGLLSYDDLVTTIAGVTQMGTLSPPGAGRQAIANAITGPDVTPRGLTAIGQGIMQGASVLDAERTAAGTPYSHFAMVVMTDGNENVTPYVTSMSVSTAIAPYSSHIYAIGLGTSTNVSAGTLGAIANYMLITGDITTNEQRFRLTKYFVQILAGITRTAIVVDPQGELLLGTEHRIPFTVADGDVSIDVIALCPLAFLLDMRLEAPDGTIVDRATMSPNVSSFVGGEDAFLRMMLPAIPGQAAGTHGGEWTAILGISRRGLSELWQQLDVKATRVSTNLSMLRKLTSLPYSLVVQSYSNLLLEVDVTQNSVNPGEILRLYARLSEYTVPVQGTGTVFVEVTDPHEGVSYVALTEHQPGAFTGSYATTVQGIYRCRFRAGGYTPRGQPIQREETRTAVVWRRLTQAGLDPSVLDEVLDRRREEVCKLLDCLLQDGGARELFAKLGLDPKRVAECLVRFCR